jgi:hypothetical protein
MLMSRSHFTFKQRNFDPETRQLRNRERDEAGDDTVEKAVQGLAESILKEDEEKRKEELVSGLECCRVSHQRPLHRYLSPEDFPRC